MAARTGCETCLGKLLHGRRDAFATGCDPGPNRDSRVDRTQPHTLTGHPDDGSRQRRGPLRGHHPLQSAQRGLAAHLPNTAKQKPLARHRWLVRKRRVHVVVGRWQRTAATPASTQPTRVRVPASKGSAKKARVLPVPTPPHRFGMEVAAPRTPGTTAGLLNNLLGRRRRSAGAHRAQVSRLAVPGRNASVSAAPPRACNPPAGRHLTPIQPQSLGAPLRGPLPHRPRVPAPGGQPAPRLRGRSLPPAGTGPCPA